MKLLFYFIFFHSCQIVIHLCFSRKALFQSFTLGFLNHSIRIRNKKVILIYLTPRDYQLQFIVSYLRPIKLSTLFSHELLAFVSILVSSPKQSVFIFERITSKKINLVIVIIFPLRKKYIFGSVNVANWNKFLIWTAKY